MTQGAVARRSFWSDTPAPGGTRLSSPPRGASLAAACVGAEEHELTGGAYGVGRSEGLLIAEGACSACHSRRQLGARPSIQGPVAAFVCRQLSMIARVLQSVLPGIWS